MNLLQPVAARMGALALSAALVGVALGPAEAAGDVKAGRADAKKCELCHGLDGVSKLAEAPNLAGQNEQYLVEQLQAFKGGARQNDMMSLIAQQLSDKDIGDLAAYYAAIEVKVGKVPGQ